jgi:hypothetical protein
MTGPADVALIRMATTSITGAVATRITGLSTRSTARFQRWWLWTRFCNAPVLALATGRCRIENGFVRRVQMGKLKNASFEVVLALG